MPRNYTYFFFIYLYILLLFSLSFDLINTESIIKTLPGKRINTKKEISEYMKNTVLFLHRTPEKGLVYEVAVNGLGEHMGLDDIGLADCLNTGEFCTWVEGYRAIPHREYTEQFISSILGHPRGLTVHLPQGKTMHLEVRADRVKNKKSTVEYIVIMNEMP